MVKEDIKKNLDRFLECIAKAQIDRLTQLGEMCVSHARNVPSGQGFHDHTGNLRPSIGYAVFDDGVAVHYGYKQVNEGNL